MIDRITDQAEKIEVGIRAKAEHPFRVIKRQFSRGKVRYRSLAKNTADLKTFFALSNLWQSRKKLLVLDGQVRLKTAYNTKKSGMGATRHATARGFRPHC